jgi:hypothetical protein
LYHRFARRPPGWRTHIFVFGFRRVLDLPVLIVGAHAIRPASSEVGGNIPLCCANLHGIAHSPTYNPRPVIPALRYGRRSQPVPAGRAPPTAAPGCCSCTQRIERRACDPPLRPHAEPTNPRSKPFPPSGGRGRVRPLVSPRRQLPPDF